MIPLFLQLFLLEWLLKPHCAGTAVPCTMAVPRTVRCGAGPGWPGGMQATSCVALWTVESAGYHDADHPEARLVPQRARRVEQEAQHDEQQ